MEKYIFFFIILIFILLNIHFFYVIIFSNIHNSLWIRNMYNKFGYKYIKNIYDYSFNNSIEQYFDSLEKNKIHKNLVFPTFDNLHYINKHDVDYSNYKIYGKHNSLSNKMNNLTTPFFWKGDSIFRIDYENRGRDNFTKKEYLKGLTSEKLNLYRNVIKNYFNDIKKDIYVKKKKEYNLHDFCLKITTDLLYLLHFGEKPKKEDFKDINLFIESLISSSFTFYYSKTSMKHLYNLKFFIKRIYQKIKQCEQNRETTIVYSWLNETSFTKQDIIIEFIHNIIGLVINWTNTIYNYLLELIRLKIPYYNKEMDMNKYILESFRYLCPVRFVSSKIKNQNAAAIHDVKISTREETFFGNNTNSFNLNRMENYNNFMSKNTDSKCPFYNSINKSTVPKNLSIYENEGYTVFGSGYRRCPGEHLSMIFLEEFIYFLDNKKINILRKGKENKKHFIWDKVDKNLVILF